MANIPGNLRNCDFDEVMSKPSVGKHYSTIVSTNVIQTGLERVTEYQ